MAALSGRATHRLQESPLGPRAVPANAKRFCRLLSASSIRSSPQRALKGQAQIGLRVGKVIGRFMMAKHFTLTITEDRFTYAA
ncbi:MAG: hypothetical protein ACREVK_05630 [Gammaproteobacteria bacterium]